MKKLVYFAALLLTTVFASCEKEEIGGTATESMAGMWYCIVDAVDENGDPILSGEDYFGEGKTILLTYNTAGNSASEMWVDNMGIGNFSANYSSYFLQYIDILNGDTVAARIKYHNGFPELGMPGFPVSSIRQVKRLQATNLHSVLIAQASNRFSSSLPSAEISMLKKTEAVF